MATTRIRYVDILVLTRLSNCMRIFPQVEAYNAGLICAEVRMGEMGRRASGRETGAAVGRPQSSRVHDEDDDDGDDDDDDMT